MADNDDAPIDDTTEQELERAPQADGAGEHAEDPPVDNAPNQ